MRKKGFTLAETLVVSGIMVVFTGILLAFSVQSRAIFQTTNITATLEENARLAINRMMNDLRETATAQITIIPGATANDPDAIEFYLPNETSGVPDINGVNIDWNTTKITLNLDTGSGELRRNVDGGGYTVIARNVTNIKILQSVAYPRELKITLSLSRNSSGGRAHNITDFTTFITMRN